MAVLKYIIIFTYTTCKYVCQLQGSKSEKRGKSIFKISFYNND